MYTYIKNISSRAVANQNRFRNRLYDKSNGTRSAVEQVQVPALTKKDVIGTPYRLRLFGASNGT